MLYLIRIWKYAKGIETLCIEGKMTINEANDITDRLLDTASNEFEYYYTVE